MSTSNQSENNINMRELICDKQALQIKVDTLNFKLNKQTDESDRTIQSLHKKIEILTIENEDLQRTIHEKEWLEMTVHEFQQSNVVYNSGVIYPPSKLVRQSCSDTYSELYKQYTIDMQYSPDPLQIPIVEELTADEKIEADKDFALKAQDIWFEYKRDEKMNDATEQMLANV
jgi:hypothetical protein